MSSIKLKNVSIYYRNKKDIITAVDDISLTFHDHKTNVLVGFSGCGKSSILNAISGYILFDGEIYLDEENILDIAVQKRNISYVNQEIVLYPHLTIYDNIAYPLKLLKLPRDQIDIRVKELAYALDIDFLLTRKPKYLSIGQQQRVAIARALNKDSNILFCDEPTGALDDASGKAVLDLLDRIHKDGKTIVFVTHTKEIAMMADRVITMKDGKIVKEEINEHPVSASEVKW